MNSIARVRTIVTGWLATLTVLGLCGGPHRTHKWCRRMEFPPLRTSTLKSKGGIDEDIGRHLGDVPRDPGVKGKTFALA